jgi:hypothetical protein
MIQAQRGNIDQAIVDANGILNHAKHFNQKDIILAMFIGNIAEMIYNQDKSQKSLEYMKDARIWAWYALRDLGLEIETHDINGTAT